MSGVQCKCGRYLAAARPVLGYYPESASYIAGEAYIADVVGDCSRCGPGVQAHEDDWHHSWDAWNWREH
jgi:hypothetical protein